MKLAQVHRRDGEDRERRRPQRAPCASLAARYGGKRYDERNECVGQQAHADR